MTVVDADVDFGELDRQGGLGVRCLGVVHLYRTFEGHDVVALQGVDLSIRPGERVAFLGPSGSGKSTLLTLLGGIQRPSAGRILLGDAEISRLPEPELARLGDEATRAVPDFTVLFEHAAADEARRETAAQPARFGAANSQCGTSVHRVHPITASRDDGQRSGPMTFNELSAVRIQFDELISLVNATH